MNSYGQCGFENSGGMNQNFGFSSPASSRFSPERPYLSSFSSFSRPRTAKSKKPLGSRSLGSSESRKKDLGFNPFYPVPDNRSGVSSRMESDDDDVAPVDMSKHLNLKVKNKVENLDNAFIEKTAKLKIECQTDSHIASRGANNLNEGQNASLSGIQRPSKGFENSEPFDLADGMENLNLGDLHGGNSKNLNVTQDNFGGNCEASLGFDRDHNIGGLFGANSLSELPKDFEKLNLKNAGEISGGNFTFSTTRRDFVFGSSRKNSDTNATGIASTLHEKIKNLNIEDSDKNNGAQRDEKQGSFGFSSTHDGSRVPGVESRIPHSKCNLFSGSNQEIEYVAKKGSVKDTLLEGRKDKMKESTSVLVSLGKSFVPKENSSKACSEPSESYSPMDVSPYPETPDDAQSAREPYLASDNQTSNYSQTAFSNDGAEEDLVTAKECMDKHDVAKASAGSLEDSMSGFKSASEELDRNEENEHESSGEGQSPDPTRYFSASSPVNSGASSFMFAASSSAQGQVSASIRQQKKKNRMKAGSDNYIPTQTVLSDAAKSSQFSPVSRVSALLPSVVKKDGGPSATQKGGINLKVSYSTSNAKGGSNVEDTKREVSSVTSSNVEDTKREITSVTPESRGAQEACEKWRLRGNQAYSSGNLEKAEDCYTQGLGCIPQNEISRECLRALVLCYSNRAAARMSLGRIREALQDCLVAAELDPDFFWVQIRAAKCYLALGEVADASRYFQKLLQRTDVYVEEKIIREASHGLQKAEKVSECMDRSAELLVQTNDSDVETALSVISDALAISPYSEQLLECKAETLFMLRRHEEVIQLCMQTMEVAEKNSLLVGAKERSSNLESAELLKNYYFRIWRYCHIFKANFHLGKLEEAVDFLEKQEQWRSMVKKYGNETLDSLIPQLSIARELIRHKSVGNEAFQSGRHTEAVEQYTAALSFNVESCPFAALCLGNRAAAYQALGQITDAIADCSLAIALDGNYVKGISRRATLFEMIRDYEQAAKDLERVVPLLTKQAEENGNSGASLMTCSSPDVRQARQRLYQMEEQANKGLPLNFYLILGVEPSATAADLKKAYRKAALKHHPDKAGQSLTRSESGDDGLWKEIADEVYKDADRLFKMIGEAYTIISDPNKRSQYDTEEETRNSQKKSSSGTTSRMHTDPTCNKADRSGFGSGRQWKDAPWKSSAKTYSRGFEPTRSTRRQ